MLPALGYQNRQILAQRAESSRVILLQSARILVIGGLIFSLLSGHDAAPALANHGTDKKTQE
jgi:hypothetical protein